MQADLLRSAAPKRVSCQLIVFLRKQLRRSPVGIGKKTASWQLRVVVVEEEVVVVEVVVVEVVAEKVVVEVVVVVVVVVVAVVVEVVAEEVVVGQWEW